MRFTWIHACGVLRQCQVAIYHQNISLSILRHLWPLVRVLEIICLTLFLTISALVFHDLVVGGREGLQGEDVFEYVLALDFKWKFRGDSPIDFPSPAFTFLSRFITRASHLC